MGVRVGHRRGDRIKPSLWQVDPTLVAPEWQWAWRGLVFAATIQEGGGAPFDVVTGERAANFEADVAWGVGENGPQLEYSDGANSLVRWANSTRFRDLTGDMTYLARVRVDRDNSTTFDLFCAIEGGTGETEAENATLFLNCNTTVEGQNVQYIHERGSGTNETVRWNGFFTVGVPFLFGITRAVNGNKVKAYKDGEQFGADFDYTGDPTITADPDLMIGSREGQAGSELDGMIDFTYLWDRTLTANEMRLLATDPYGPFRMASRPAGFVTVVPPTGIGGAYYQQYLRTVIRV